MVRFLALSALAVGLLASGCATTKNVISAVTPGPSTPIDQVLKIRPEIRNNLVTVEIRQFFDNAELPTAGQVKVTEAGLLDDSVKAVQTIYHFKLIGRDWKLLTTENMYQCVRGVDPKKFQKEPCP